MEDWLVWAGRPEVVFLILFLHFVTKIPRLGNCKSMLFLILWLYFVDVTLGLVLCVVIDRRLLLV